MPEGVSIRAVYDRSELILRAIATLKHTLLEEGLIVALVCMVFLMHARSALVAIVMLPIGVLMAFIAMHALGLNSNIMSLGGIAIAIGAMVDAAIVMIENAHKHLERLAARPSVRAVPINSVRPEPSNSVRPELVEGTSGAPNKIVGTGVNLDAVDRSPFDGLRANGGKLGDSDSSLSPAPLPPVGEGACFK